MPPPSLAAAAIAVALLASAPAHAELDGLRFEPPRTVQYRCDDGQRITARYYNSPDNQIAILRLDGKRLLFVNVLSASGARYAHGHRVWWTKGAEARLTDLTQGENAPPVHGVCRAAP